MIQVSNMANRQWVSVWVLLAACLFLSGCMRSRPSRFYTLHAVLPELAPAAAEVEASFPEIRLGVGPIELPGYLDRGQIVTRMERHEVKVSEFHRWADSIAREVQSIVEDNLEAALPGAGIYEYKLRRKLNLTHQVMIDVDELIGQPGEDVILKAKWAVIHLAVPEEQALHQSGIYRCRTKGSSYNDVVSAMSLLLGDLCRDIAKSIKPSIGQD